MQNITPIPDVNTFLDVVLSRTQRKTPTVIRSGFKVCKHFQFNYRIRVVALEF